MADQRYATWENFRRHYLDPRVPAEMVVVGTPEVRIEVGDHCHSLTLLVESDRYFRRVLSGTQLYRSPLARDKNVCSREIRQDF